MDSQWLKLQFKNNPEKSKAELAKALGLEPPAISKILANSRQIKAKEYAIMRRFFNLPVDETQIKAQQTTRAYSKHPYFSLQDGSDNLEATSWKIPDHVIQKRLDLPSPNIRLYKVFETMMEPLLHKGEYIALDTSDTKAITPGIFMISDGYSMMIRHCEIPNSKTDKEIHISAFDHSFQTQIVPLDDIEIIGRVIAKLEWV